MIPQRAADQQHITGANLLRPPVNVRRDGADAGGVNKQLIRRAARHHFSVAGDDGDPCARAVSAMLATTASRVAISSPSSRIKPQER